jgi:hypothetical protein
MMSGSLVHVFDSFDIVFSLMADNQAFRLAFDQTNGSLDKPEQQQTDANW